MNDEEIIRKFEIVGGMLKGSYGRDEWDTVHMLEEKLREKDYQEVLRNITKLYAAPSCFASCQPNPFQELQPVRMELESRVRQQEWN